MNNDLYFHDGNVISIFISRFDNDSTCEITIDLYESHSAKNRQRYKITAKKISRLSLLGDFLEINKNHFAGIIEDGSINTSNGSDRLTLRITGGYLEVLGTISIVSDIVEPTSFDSIQMVESA